MKIRKDGKVFDDTLGYNNPVLLDSGTKAVSFTKLWEYAKRGSIEVLTDKRGLLI